MLWVILAVLVSLTEAKGLGDYTRNELMDHFRQSKLLTPSGEEGKKIRDKESKFKFEKIRNDPDFKLIVQRINAIESFLDTGELKDYTFDTYNPIDRLEVTLSGYSKRDKNTRVTVNFLTVEDKTKIEDHRGLKAFQQLLDKGVPYLATIKSKSCIKLEGQPQLCPVVMTAGIPVKEIDSNFAGFENPEDLEEEEKIANSEILVAYLVEVTKVFEKINSLKFYYGDICSELLMWKKDKGKIVPVIGYSNLVVEIIEDPKTPNKLAPLPFMLYRPFYRPYELDIISNSQAFPSENHLGHVDYAQYTRNADFREESYALGTTLRLVIKYNEEYTSKECAGLVWLSDRAEELQMEQPEQSNKNKKDQILRPSIKEFYQRITEKGLKIIRI